MISEKNYKINFISLSLISRRILLTTKIYFTEFEFKFHSILSPRPVTRFSTKVENAYYARASAKPLFISIDHHDSPKIPTFFSRLRYSAGCLEKCWNIFVN